MIYGVIRRDVLAKTSGFRSIWGPDNVLLVELALWGPFAQIKEPLFYRRYWSEEEAGAKIKRVSNDTDPQNAARWDGRSMASLYNEMYWGYLQTIAHGPIKSSEKVLLINFTLADLFIRHMKLIKNKMH
jgi:hypothetical protein